MAERSSIFVKVGWWLAGVLAGLVTFAGTGPGYHATIRWVFYFSQEQYGTFVAALVVWLWWGVVAVLLFLLSLLGIVIAFLLALFLIRTWLP